MDLDVVLKILGVFGGAGILGAVGAWFSHFFASGDTRIADRRKDKDEQQKRIENLESTITILNRNLLVAGYFRNLQTTQINRLTWLYDDMLKVLGVMSGIVAAVQPDQTYLLEKAKSFPKAEAVLDDAERVFKEANPSLEGEKNE